MTSYAIDRARRELIAVWRESSGSAAQVVTRLPGSPGEWPELTDTLSRLSRALWRTYTHPVSATVGHQDVAASEAWRRAGEQAAVQRVDEVIRNPHLPTGGMLVTSYFEVEEAANALGRALRAIDDRALTEAVLAEVGAEIEGVSMADRGDLSARAVQAIHLSRTEASPTQVQAAFETIAQHPLLSRKALLTESDPSAASVAAAAWLLGAAKVASKASGEAVHAVVREADNIEALAWETPSEVLRRLQHGHSPREVVVGLIRDALQVAEGRASGSASDGSARLCWLDPARPAPDLLEDLLDGIYGCFLLWCECVEPEGSSISQGHNDEELHIELFSQLLRSEMATADRYAL